MSRFDSPEERLELFRALRALVRSFVGTEGEDNGAAAGPRRSARLAQRQQAAPADGDGRRRSRRLAARAGGDGADGADGAGAEGDAANTSDADMGIDWESDEESYVEDEDAEFDDDDEEVDYVDDDEDEDFDDVTSDSGIVGGYAAVPTSDVGPLSDDARRMAEGLYSGVMLDKLRSAKPSPLRLLRQRETAGRMLPAHQVAAAAAYVPNKKVGTLDHGDGHFFCGSYSADGLVYMSACQSGTITLHDTVSDSVIRRVVARDVGWSIIDTDYSPDQRFLIYSSWSRHIHLCNVYMTEGSEVHLPLLMVPPNIGYHSICLFSIKFSPDSREILGGSSANCIHLYNVERQAVVSMIDGHHDDVNAVAWADDSGQVFLSGGDDAVCKVWDRRAPRHRPMGKFVGHRHGITYINPKGDGRYLITNGKDQTIKLWDMRHMARPNAPEWRQSAYDYRFMAPSIAPQRLPSLPDDTSLRTYTGHRVVRTLIRAKFSPATSTGQQYIYSGSADGNIYVWDVLTGNLVRKLTRGHSQIVRDVSWHPYLPRILSASWDTTVGIWDYKPDAIE